MIFDYLCRGVYITDSVSVENWYRWVNLHWVNLNVGYYVAFHTGECEFRFIDFSRNCELRFRLKFHHRRYAPAGGSYQNFACGKFF